MRQRVVIARALTVDPEVLVADEAVSMIDVSLRLEVLRLLRDLRERLGISVLLITHDVATTRYLGPGGELYVIYRGQVVEHGRTDTVVGGPVHPYTQCLLAAIPVLSGIEEPGPQRPVPLGALLGRLGGTAQEHACRHPERRAVVPAPASRPSH
jgi:peptide/nickel transport system ATP-binding protein